MENDRNIILTCYLCARPDPQYALELELGAKLDRGPKWKPDDSNVVRTWIESLTRCGLQGIIFHDSCSPEFCDDWSSETVRFLPVHWNTPWTAAEERVRIYRDFLQSADWERVLTTDLSDVEFYRDPFPLMTDSNMLYIGSERRLIGKSCIAMMMQRTYGEVTDADKPILNPGVVGGYGSTVLRFCHRWLEEMDRAIKPTPPPHDICAFNRLIYREKIPYVTGHPLHTVFKRYASSASGAAIRLK